MLVLSRKESESLVINENIVITIIRIAGGGVRLGIDAPREIPVRREELASLRELATCAETAASVN
jgi:carbon storage regulator